MFILRVIWSLLAVLAVAHAIWLGSEQMLQVSWCEVDLPSGPVRTFEQCASPIVTVLGVWPVVGVGTALALPLALAALAMRTWVSWLAVATLVGLAIVAVVNWSSYLIMLLGAGPLAFVSLVVATAQQVIVNSRKALSVRRTPVVSYPAGP